MKLLLLPFLFAFSLLAAEPDWLMDFDEAKARAAAENKPIMMMISRVGCPACEYMEDFVLVDDEIRTYLDAYFVSLHLDVDETEIPKGFRVFGTPTFYFLDPSGKKIGRQLAGALKKGPFLEKLRSVRQ